MIATISTNTLPPILRAGAPAAAAILNGRNPRPVKLALDHGWVTIDETGPTPARQPCPSPRTECVPASANPATPAPFANAVREAAIAGGWQVTESPEGPRVELVGRRTARARAIDVVGRGPALAVVVLAEDFTPPEPAVAFALRLTASLRMVRASWLHLPEGPRLVWEVPFPLADIRETALIDALGCLSLAVRNGQQEAILLARSGEIAHRWLQQFSP